MIKKKETALAAISRGNSKIGQWSEELFFNEDLVLAALRLPKTKASDLADMPPGCFTEAISLELVKKDGEALRLVPKVLRTKKVCLEAVKNAGWAIEFVPENLCDEEIYMAAVSQNGRTIGVVPEEMLTPEMCIAAIDEDPTCLGAIPERFRTPEACLAAVKKMHRYISMITGIPENVLVGALEALVSKEKRPLEEEWIVSARCGTELIEPALFDTFEKAHAYAREFILDAAHAAYDGNKKDPSFGDLREWADVNGYDFDDYYFWRGYGDAAEAIITDAAEASITHSETIA